MILLVASLVRSILGAPFRPQLVSDVSAQEIANYTTERFTHEPELWRIHIRTIRGLLDSIDSTTQVVDRAAATLCDRGEIAKQVFDQIVRAEGRVAVETMAASGPFTLLASGY